MNNLPILPIGTQHFRSIRTNKTLYVDKTKDIHAILKPESKYFLGRPRRFGKSLLLDTIGHLYSGKESEELFKGLWIEGKWDFEAMKRPVVKYLFASSGFQHGDLEMALHKIINQNAERHGIQLESLKYSDKQEELILKLHAKHGKIVILIDEYDKPITEYLEKDLQKSVYNRDLLRGFYAPFKDLGDKIELLFITGIARFTQTSLFSDLNQLRDLSMDSNIGAICGITQKELELSFEPFFPELEEEFGWDRERLLAQIKLWYNGYKFHRKAESVYNPFSLLNFFQSKHFGSYWHLSGMPYMMRPYIVNNPRLYDMDGIRLSEPQMQSFDIANLDLRALMFQTGYLTISDYDMESMEYRLVYPNMEVRQAFSQFLLSTISRNDSGELSLVSQLRETLIADDFDSVSGILNRLYAQLPYDIFLSEMEAYYHSILHLTFVLLGINTESEVHSKNGRCDMLVRIRQRYYVFECKMDKSADLALEQARKRNYGEKYAAMGYPVVRFGVNFSSAEKKVQDIKWEVGSFVF